MRALVSYRKEGSCSLLSSIVELSVSNVDSDEAKEELRRLLGKGGNISILFTSKLKDEKAQKLVRAFSL